MKSRVISMLNDKCTGGSLLFGINLQAPHIFPRKFEPDKVSEKEKLREKKKIDRKLEWNEVAVEKAVVSPVGELLSYETFQFSELVFPSISDFVFPFLSFLVL